LVVVATEWREMRTVEELVARAPDRFDITVIGGEPHPSYYRILSKPSRQGRRSVFSA